MKSKTRLTAWTGLLFGVTCFFSVALALKTLDADEFEKRALVPGIFVLACE